MSPQQIFVEFTAWLSAAPPEFLFLMTLPIFIAVVVLARDAMHARRLARERVQASTLETADAGGIAAQPAAMTRMPGSAMPRILIPVDGSESALRAVRHVVNQSLARGGVEAHLLYVRAPFTKYVAGFTSKKSRDAHHREMAEQALAGARELLNRYSVPHSVHTDAGDRAECIHRMAQRLRVDKIVMGTARKNSLTRIIQDSVSSRVLALAQVPVEVIVSGSVSKLERYGVPAGIGTALAALTVAVTD